MKKLFIKVLQRRSGRISLGILCLLLAFSILLWALIDRNIKPVALAIAEARVRAIASDAINNAVRICVQDVAYSDLVTVTRDAYGKISMLQANSGMMNQIAADTSITAQRFIAQIDSRQVAVPLGSLFGGPILSGRGPEIPVKVLPAGSVVSSFETSFTSAGINQTRHEIYLMLQADMQIAIPVGADEIRVSITVPVAESVIVGEVPQTFVTADNNREELLDLIPDSSLD